MKRMLEKQDDPQRINSPLKALIGNPNTGYFWPFVGISLFVLSLSVLVIAISMPKDNIMISFDANDIISFFLAIFAMWLSYHFYQLSKRDSDKHRQAEDEKLSTIQGSLENLIAKEASKAEKDYRALENDLENTKQAIQSESTNNVELSKAREELDEIEKKLALKKKEVDFYERVNDPGEKITLDTLMYDFGRAIATRADRVELSSKNDDALNEAMSYIAGAMGEQTLARLDSLGFLEETQPLRFNDYGLSLLRHILAHMN